MSETVYDEIDIDDMEYDEDLQTFFYPCPCGDRFQISEDDILDGETIARCPSCTLMIRVIYDPDDFASGSDDDDRQCIVVCLGHNAGNIFAALSG